MISLGVRLVLPVADAVWTRDMELEIAPFPGLAIRVDTYEVLNVVSVRVPETGGRVRCVIGPDADSGPKSESGAAAFGFAPERADGGSADTDSGAECGLSVLLVTNAADQMWCKQIRLPFAPFGGLQVEVGAHVLNVFSVVVKDDLSDITCLASFEGDDAARLTEDDCLALGLEECVYP
ncbi:MAG TPA: hypothetical protein VFN97_03480 [Actinospica sp.]|nr:hypothetical protein [Actinospica sp.]